MKINIKPVTKTFDKLVISNIQVSLQNDAVLQVYLEGTETDNQIYNLYMDQPTYAGWGDDDEYVVDWTLNQLGLQKG
jgi:hypothetical protein